MFEALKAFNGVIFSQCIFSFVTDIFTKNVFQTKDCIYHNLKKLIREKDVVVMKGGKDSSVVILNKTDYIEKLENMVKEGTDKGTYTLTEDNTIKYLKNFKQFLIRNFKGYYKLDYMLPTSNQPARIYASAKTHKFSSVDSININDLKFQPIRHILSNISQTKSNQTVKFGQLIEYNQEIIFFGNHAKNDAERLVPDLTFSFKKALFEVKASGMQLSFSSCCFLKATWEVKPRG